MEILVYVVSNFLSCFLLDKLIQACIVWSIDDMVGCQDISVRADKGSADGSLDLILSSILWECCGCVVWEENSQAAIQRRNNTDNSWFGNIDRTYNWVSNIPSRSGFCVYRCSEKEY